METDLFHHSSSFTMPVLAVLPDRPCASNQRRAFDHIKDSLSGILRDTIQKAWTTSIASSRLFANIVFASFDLSVTTYCLFVSIIRHKRYIVNSIFY